MPNRFFFFFFKCCFILPPGVYEYSSCPTCLATFDVVNFFVFSHSNRCIVVSYQGSNLHFPDGEQLDLISIDLIYLLDILTSLSFLVWFTLKYKLYFLVSLNVWSYLIARHYTFFAFGISTSIFVFILFLSFILENS